MAKKGRTSQHAETVERIDINVSRGTPNQRPSVLVGSVCFAAGLVLVISALFEYLLVDDLEGNNPTLVLHLPLFLLSEISKLPDSTPTILLFIPGALLFVAGYFFIKLGYRHFVTTYRANSFRSSGDMLIYLRPFDADRSPVRRNTPVDFFLLGFFDTRYWVLTWLFLRGIHRYEELIAYAFRKVGKLVTIGDPRERLPQLGASRVYTASPGSTGRSDGDIWKACVAEQIAGAKVIMAHIGVSDAIRWEIETVVARADPQRVLLCVNPVGSSRAKFRGLGRVFRFESIFRAELTAAWSQFREVCGGIFPYGLPESLEDGRFVKFAADWTAIPVQSRKRRIAWFIPNGTSRPRGGTIEGAIDWLLWIMIPEPILRRITRKMINFVTLLVFLVLLFFLAGCIFDLLR